MGTFLYGVGTSAKGIEISGMLALWQKKSTPSKTPKAQDTKSKKSKSTKGINLKTDWEE